MGNFSSQYLEEWANSTKNATEGSLIRKDDATDNLTPKNKDVRWLPWDPRSPSRAIKRTPIQVILYFRGNQVKKIENFQSCKSFFFEY